MIDFSALFGQLFSSFWWLLPLFVLASLFKSPWFKGVMGEAMVNLSARLLLNRDDYHLIKNVTIPTGDGTTWKPCSLHQCKIESIVRDINTRLASH